MKDPTLESAREYVRIALASYDGDPADSAFQDGFQACLEVVAREALGMDIRERPEPRKRPALRLVERKP